MFYGRFTFTAELTAEAVLPPYKGSTFRGAFGTALKRIVCARKRQTCENCLLGGSCVYAFFFEQIASEKAAPNSLPHPFVIEPPLISKTHFGLGESFDFNLLLFGRATDYIPYCIYAFEQMGKIGIGKHVNGRRAGFVLKTVTSAGDLIYSDEDRRLIPVDGKSQLTIEPGEPNVQHLKVSVKTPLRVKHENRLKAELPFHVLIRATLRRISSLFTYYGDGEPVLDYKGLVERARAVEIIKNNLHWFDWSRYSNRQETKMLMGGMIGDITYSGKLDEFIPLLRLCETVHIGKQTTFGLGLIKLEFG